MYDTYEPDNTEQSWRVKLNSVRSGYGIINTSYLNSKDSRFGETEVGLSHPENGSHVKIHDDGTIDIFASSTLGIRLDPKHESINIFSKKMSINTQSFDVQVNPANFKFNSQPIDIDKLEVRDEKKGQIYSEKFNTLLKELGINE